MLYNIFYLNGIKHLPANLIDYLTPVSLAFWIMSDGYCRGSGVALWTDFTLEEVELIISARVLSTLGCVVLNLFIQKNKVGV